MTSFVFSLPSFVSLPSIILNPSPNKNYPKMYGWLTQSQLVLFGKIVPESQKYLMEFQKVSISWEGIYE
jgi:hypothetical protein